MEFFPLSPGNYSPKEDQNEERDMIIEVLNHRISPVALANLSKGGRGEKN